MSSNADANVANCLVQICKRKSHESGPQRLIRSKLGLGRSVCLNNFHFQIDAIKLGAFVSKKCPATKYYHFYTLQSFSKYKVFIVVFILRSQGNDLDDKFFWAETDSSVKEWVTGNCSKARRDRTEQKGQSSSKKDDMIKEMNC